MKFQKPSEKTLITTGATVGGAVVGAMVGRGMKAMVIEPSGATDDATLKKEKNKAMLVSLALIGVGLAAGSSVKSDDTASQLAKGACYGIAIEQTLSLVKSFAENSPTIKTGIAATTKTQKFLANAVGLGCACSNPMLNGARRRRKPSLRFTPYQPIAPIANRFENDNALDAAVDLGARA